MKTITALGKNLSLRRALAIIIEKSNKPLDRVEQTVRTTAFLTSVFG